MERSAAILAVACLLSSTLHASAARASCNQIPGTTNSFRAALGATNRPFAGPGDFVELRLSHSCDGGSSGFSDAAEGYTVTVVFKPPIGPRNVVVLSADCSRLESQRQICAAQPGVANVNCLTVNLPGEPIDLEVVERDGDRRLRFRFPDTDALLDGLDDDRTFTGPATLAVTKVGDPLPCQLWFESCAQQSALVACVDALFATNGSCDTTPHPTFPNFTALPPPNNYQALCIDPEPPFTGPCTGLARELRLTIDMAGNILLPMDWRGVLVRRADVPIPRLVRASANLEAFQERPGEPIHVPSKDFLASFSPEGSKLPPVFDPQFDPDAKGTLTLFGSADAAETVLRIARQSPTGLACTGGEQPGVPCRDDNECSDGSCELAPPLFDLSARLLASVGPVLLPRFGSGICQNSEAPCIDDTTCGGSRCASYRATAEHPAPLDGLIETPDVFVSLVPEAIEDEDLNEDGDKTDEVLLLADRRSGKMHSIGTTSGQGRAITRIRRLPITFPAVAAERDIVAFLEPEPLEGYHDVNGDGDVFDTILRVFQRTPEGTTEIAAEMNLAIDAEPLIGGRTVAISNGRVFVRLPEWAGARQVTTLISLNSNGEQANGDSSNPAISGDGHLVAFQSQATNLVNGDQNGAYDIFVRDLRAQVTERVSTARDDTDPDCNSSGPAISADGRYVAFTSCATNVVDEDEDTNGLSDVFVYDRETKATERVSVATTGVEGNGDSASPVISADGRFVAYRSVADDLVQGDTNSVADVFLRDRDLGTTELLSKNSCDEEGNQSSGSPTISGDGHFVSFQSVADNLVEDSANEFANVFVRDRQTRTTAQVSVDSQGSEGDSASSRPSISLDGRFVAFASVSTNLTAGDTNGFIDTFLYDRERKAVQIVSVSSSGELANSASLDLAISGTGRLVAFQSFANNLVEGDVNQCAPFSGCFDIFLHDARTGMTDQVSLDSNRIQPNDISGGPAIAADGRTVAFDSGADNLVGVGGDHNNSRDVFVRGPDPSDSAHDLFADGELDDTVLAVLDTDSGSLTVLCPAEAVAVAGGAAAYLRPEAPVGTAECPSGSLNAADTDTTDLVPQVWQPNGFSGNLGRAATAIAFSGSWVAALISEAGEGGTDLNGDGDTEDTVVGVFDVRGASPVETILPQAAETIEVSGSIVAFMTPEAAQGVDLNGDGDTSDRVLQVYDAGTGQLLQIGQAAEEFVLGDHLIAFRTSEDAQGAHDLNGDGDIQDYVLQVYDVGSRRLLNTRQAVTPCRLEACDPRVPYRVLNDTVKFLTLEVDQNDDLNGDGDINDLVLQTVNVRQGMLVASAGAAAGTMQLSAHSRTSARGAAVHAEPLTTVGGVAAGICTNTGQPCAVRASCQTACGDDECRSRAQCFVPPGGCIKDLGDTAPCDPQAQNPCGERRFCTPLPNRPGEGTCHELILGADGKPLDCTGDESCQAQDPAATCNDAGQRFQRLAAPLLAPAAGGEVFISAGRCIETSGREQGTCRTDADCPGGAVCRQELLTAVAADSDGDELADPFDNCPQVANIDQRDADEDGTGDACDLTPVATPLARLSGDMVEGQSGETIPVAFTLSTDGLQVSVITDYLQLPAGILPVRCFLNSMITDKILGGSQPRPGELRLLIYGFNQTSLPDGLLFTCDFEIASAAEPGCHQLQHAYLSAADPRATSVPIIGDPGEICIVGPKSTGTVTPTSTPTTSFTPCTPAYTATGTATMTETPTATTTHSATASSTPTSSGTSTPTNTVKLERCTGDCDDSGNVAVNELVLGVNIALDQSPVSVCRAFDQDEDEQVRVDELTTGVNNALKGCPPVFSATPTPTSTPTTTTPTPTSTTTRTTISTDTPAPSATPTVPATESPTPTRCVTSLEPNLHAVCCYLDCGETNVCEDSSGGSGCFNVIAPDDCQWTAVGTSEFEAIVTSGSSGSGNGQVCYAVGPYYGVLGGRVVDIDVGGVKFKIGQLRPPTPGPSPPWAVRFVP